MTTAPTTSRSPGGGRIRVVLIAGAGAVGMERSAAVLDRLPGLACPIVVCLRDADVESLGSHLHGVDLRWAAHGVALDDGPLWVAPPDRQTVVRDGRFEVTEPGDGPAGAGLCLVKMYHSLRLAYGSRGFVVISDPDRSDTPHLRLLAQRGATVVSTLECAAPGVDVWPVERIVAHLGAEVGARHGQVVA